MSLMWFCHFTELQEHNLYYFLTAVTLFSYLPQMFVWFTKPFCANQTHFHHSPIHRPAQIKYPITVVTCKHCTLEGRGGWREAVSLIYSNSKRKGLARHTYNPRHRSRMTSSTFLVKQVSQPSQ